MADHTLDRSTRLLATAGAVLGFLAVLFGAFGAHALRSRLDPDRLAVFETAVRYQLVHALAVLAAAWAAGRRAGSGAGGRLAGMAGWLFVAGTLLFSGSLVALALSGVRGLGVVTPFGGLALLAGWVLLAVAFARR